MAQALANKFIMKKMGSILFTLVAFWSELHSTELPHKVLIGNDTCNVLNVYISDSTFKYYLDSTVIANVPFDGKWCIVYPKTNLTYAIFETHSGKLNGVSYVYYPNGNICSYSTLIENKRSGIYIHWTKSGTLDHTAIFEKGIIASNLVYFNSKSRIKTILYFQNGTFISAKNKIFKPKPIELINLINSITYPFPYTKVID